MNDFAAQVVAGDAAGASESEPLDRGRAVLADGGERGPGSEKAGSGEGPGGTGMQESLASFGTLEHSANSLTRPLVVAAGPAARPLEPPAAPEYARASAGHLPAVSRPRAPCSVGPGCRLLEP